ncbi:hypothetical protein PBY51_021311 [Eleginops maclovinus]|uniref:Uncharacterized protein n=1 Tax=Eleginops maclovinus TaxID=56733 RepID=A0AAN8AH75_ELEMC|nr:hypothetical protein PBY51_021311 [Eleginops maclovinus]
MAKESAVVVGATQSEKQDLPQVKEGEAVAVLGACGASRWYSTVGGVPLLNACSRLEESLYNYKEERPDQHSGGQTQKKPVSSTTEDG